MAALSSRAKVHFLENDDLRSILVPAAPDESTFTATKVIITIGPGCQDVDTLAALLEAGATCARVDLTWGPVEYHRKSLLNLQEAMKRTRRLCAIIVDTVGRELMVVRDSHVTIDENGWPVHSHPVKITAGEKIVLTSRQNPPEDDRVLPINYEEFPAMCMAGDTIFLGRYLVTGSEESSCYLTVERVEGLDVVCVANNDTTLDGLLTIFHTERAAEGVSNIQNNLPVLSPADEEAIVSLAADFEIDFLSLSFTRSAEDIASVREFLDRKDIKHTKLLAKLESRVALVNYVSIVAAADGTIMSRGNLGLDVAPEKMALIQKTIITTCNVLGKPVLITRVVDTMVNVPRPTRAEATDVANAVLDGVDGILLGAETLRGKYPVETVRTILDICRQAEKVFDHTNHFDHLVHDATEQAAELTGFRSNMSALSLAAYDALEPGSSIASSSENLTRQDSTKRYLHTLESIASSAVRAADKVQAALIIVYTSTGQTASLVSKYRPPMPIMTLVIPRLRSDGMRWHLEGRSSARQCLIHSGLLPVLAAPSPSGETLLEEAIVMAGQSGLVKPHDHVVVVQMVQNNFIVKIVSVDEFGTGIKKIRPRSLVNLLKHQAGIPEDEAVVDFDSLAATRGGKDASSTPHLAGLPPVYTGGGRALVNTTSFAG